MVEEHFPPSERLLVAMHNMGVVYVEAAKTIDELARMAQMPVEEVAGIVEMLEHQGYIMGFIDPAGSKKHYLSELGILRVSSVFT